MHQCRNTLILSAKGRQGADATLYKRYSQGNERSQNVCATLGGVSTLRDLRHGWATRAAKGGTDAFALRDAGGWSSLVMPSRYVEDSAISNERVKLA